jgi:hypothetical protein
MPRKSDLGANRQDVLTIGVLLVLGWLLMHPAHARAQDDAERRGVAEDTSAFAWIMADHSPDVVIGDDESDPDAPFFGEITDMRVQGDRIYSIDRERYQFAVDTMSGNRVYEHGEYGSHPGGFLSPQRLFVGSDGRMGVFGSTGRKTYFRTSTQTAEGPRYDETSAHPSQVRDLCYTDAALYTYPASQANEQVMRGNERPRVLLRLEPPYESAASIAPLPSYLDAHDERLHPLMLQGRVRCLADDRVLLQHSFSNTIEVYESGERQQVITFPEVKPMELSVRTFDGQPYVGMTPNDSHVLASVVPLRGDEVLMQYAYRPEDWSPDGDHSPVTHDTYVVDLADGGVRYLGRTDRVFHAVSDTTYVAHRLDPFPVIEIVHRNE